MVKTSTIEKDGMGCGLMFMGVFFFGFFFKRHRQIRQGGNWFANIWVFNIQRQDKERQKGKRQRRREGDTETERMQELGKPIGISLLPTTGP